MECVKCGGSLENKARVEVNGLPYCASVERLAQLATTETEHLYVADDGGQTLNYHQSSRRV